MTEESKRWHEEEERRVRVMEMRERGVGDGGEAGGGRGGGLFTLCLHADLTHTYTLMHTVQAADINNSLLIFICSGEM